MIYIKIQFDSQFKKWSSGSQFESRFDNHVKKNLMTCILYFAGIWLGILR
jgi:hypothetical protein